VTEADETACFLLPQSITHCYRAPQGGRDHRAV